MKPQELWLDSGCTTWKHITQIKLKNLNEKIKITQKKGNGKNKENTERSETNRFLGIMCGEETKKVKEREKEGQWWRQKQWQETKRITYHFELLLSSFWSVLANINCRYQFFDICIFRIWWEYFKQFAEGWSVSWLVCPASLHYPIYTVWTMFCLSQTLPLLHQLYHLNKQYKISVTCH